MSLGFALAFIFLFLSLGKGAKWLAFYGASCAMTVSMVGRGGLSVPIFFMLLLLNGSAWYFLRYFTDREEKRSFRAVATLVPVVLTVTLLLIVALSGAGLGLVLSLTFGLILASLCVVASGGPLVQFCGLLMAADGLLMVAGFLSSWPLFLTALGFWGVMVVLGVILLPRLVWRKAEDL
ncbi:hypothetical protein PT277_07790 [Acetobacteraceae bacterium ESL0709]|nr:hypothetical protein [Acetobacteraceae bacterium ESL0697]MDF7678580.1 hypothetical protein [Acetobacteraceae bacterium ESL0709]